MKVIALLLVLCCGCSTTQIVLEKGVATSRGYTTPQTGIQMRFGESQVRPICGWLLVDQENHLQEHGLHVGMMIYGGLRYEVPLNNHWTFGTSFAGGYYHNGVESATLGGALEFRSSVDIQYGLSKNWSVGTGINYISNAGLHDYDPGLYSVVLTIGYNF